MNATLFSYALVRSYDPNTPDVTTKEEFIMQCELFAQKIESIENIIVPMVRGSLFNYRRHNWIIDALISLAYDITLEQFMSTQIPEMLNSTTRKNDYWGYIMSIPEWEGELRTDVARNMKYYKIPKMNRRWYECQLFWGIPIFMIGRNKITSENIKFGPYPMHPILRWLYMRH